MKFVELHNTSKPYQIPKSFTISSYCWQVWTHLVRTHLSTF